MTTVSVRETKLEAPKSWNAGSTPWFPHLFSGAGAGHVHVAFHGMEQPVAPEVVAALAGLAAATPDRADLVPLWVTEGHRAVVDDDGRLSVSTTCIVRDFTGITTIGTRVTGDMTGERGDDLFSVTFRHVAVLADRRASWVVVERPQGALGFETAEEYAKWVVDHIDHTRRERGEKLDALFGDEKTRGRGRWPVDSLNGWFKFLWHREHNGGELERTRAHCVDAVGRRYITSPHDRDLARMAKWSGVEPPSTSREEKSGNEGETSTVLMWVNCDPTLALADIRLGFATGGGGSGGGGTKSTAAAPLLPPKVGDVVALTSAGVTGRMRVVAAAMNRGEPVGWVCAEVTGLPDEYPGDTDPVPAEQAVSDDATGDAATCDETEDVAAVSV